MLVTVGHYHPDSPGGANRIAYEEARFLAASGHETWILGQATSPGHPEYAFDGGLHVLRYSVAELSHFDQRRAWSHQLQAKKILRKHLPQVDVIHGHCPLTYEAACDINESDVKTCYTVHSPARMELALAWRDSTFGERLRRLVGLPWMDRLEGRCLSRSSRITVLSEFTFNLILRLYGESTTKRLSIIPGWVDLERFQISRHRRLLKARLHWPTDVPVLFTVRRLVSRMGLDTLLRALNRTIKQGKKAHLFIAGDGPLRSDLEHLAQELNIASSCHFVGRTTDEELRGMYAACDAFVLPTAQLECFGLIILEALASGRPVLATPVGAIPEILGPIEPKWLAEDATEAALARLISEFLNDQLPSHSPDQLRDEVSWRYARSDQLAILVALLLS